MSTGNTEPRFYPTTFGQQFRCAGLKAHPSVAKNEFAAIRLHGEVDTAIMRRALAEVVTCHDAFRTDFPEVDGRHVQRVWQGGEIPVRYVDVGAQDETQRLAALIEERQSEVQVPFDLEHAPLARVLFLRTQPQELIVAITVEHLIIDALSMGIFWRHLFAAYAGLVNRTELPPPPPLQFGDFAIWQRARLSSERIEKLQRHWSRAFAALPGPIAWRNAHPRPVRFTYRSQSINRMLDPVTAEALKRLASVTGTNLFAVLNALCTLTVARLSDGRDILVNTAVANRRRREFAGVIGFFAHKILLRFSVADGASLGDLVRSCHRTTMESIAHGELHLELMKSIVGAPPDDSYAFRQQLSHLHYSFIKPDALRLPGLLMSPELVVLEDREVPFSHDLVLYSVLEPDGIELKLWYNTGIFDPRAAQELIDYMCALCAECASARIHENTVIRL